MKRARLIPTLLVLAVGAALAGLLAAEDANSSPVPKLAAFDAATTVRVTDRSGVTTELTGFRKVFGSQLLSGRYGDAEIQIPFDRVRAFSVRPLSDRRFEIDVLLVDRSRMTVAVAASAFETAFGGNATFGFYKIVLGRIATCEFLDGSHHEEGGRGCASGHLFFTPSWKFCPYDGKKLEKIEPEAIDDGSIAETSDDPFRD